MIERKKLEYVSVSDVFEGMDDEFEEFMERDLNCTWGDNQCSLVKPKILLDGLEDGEFPELHQRLTDLGDTLIDMES